MTPIFGIWQFDGDSDVGTGDGPTVYGKVVWSVP